MSIKVEKPGLLTTFQDLGRYGFQKQGMVVSGAMDKYALRIANLLVGNAEGEAVLEINFVGPSLVFEEDALIALTGANLSPKLNGKPISINRPIYIKQGTKLEFGSPVKGCRAYLAVAGGFDVQLVMGSASTYVRAGLGGWEGRALQKGDVLPVKGVPKEQPHYWQQQFPLDSTFHVAKWGASLELLPPYAEHPTIRVLTGPEFDLFSEESKSVFWKEAFTVSSASDRMGYRIEGPALQLKQPVELISSAVTFGTVQVTPSGNPIILMAEHQTTGGYPRIGQVISADLPVLAQVKPGSSIRFQQVSLAEAYALYYQQERHLEHLKRAIYLQLKR